MRYLLILSREFQIWSEGLEDYTKDYVDDIIQIQKEEYSNKRLIYEETVRHINEDFCDLSRGLKDFLGSFYQHRSMVLSIPEVAPLELEGVAILQAVFDKESDLYVQYADALHYYLYEACLDKDGKWQVAVVFNESRENEKLTLEAYGYAFDEIKCFTEWVEDNKFAYRLEDLATRLKVYCQIKAEKPEDLARIRADIQDERVATLLDKDIVQDIIRVLGKEKKKRVQIVKETQYGDGGYIGSTLSELKRAGILKHKLPHYWVNPAYYERLGICPDKDGQ